VSDDSNYCADCKRLKDIACTCGMTFKDKVKSVNAVLPPGFKAAKNPR
jgi:hypothetical protein